MARVDSPAPHRFTFGQLSGGLQLILIFILIGSCAGGSNNSVTDQGASQSEVQQLSDEIVKLEREVRRLRADVERLR
jgi:outer membrane murein-binding lipoprotein Lpp